MAKIQLKVTLENANSKEKFDLDCPYESETAAVIAAEERLSRAIGTDDLIRTLQNEIKPGSELYEHFLGIFVWKGHDKSGWHDVIVYIREVIAGDHTLTLDEDELYANDQRQMAALQLERGTPVVSMHFIDEI